MRRTWTIGLVGLLAAAGAAPAMAHCQVPCGIYDDLMRVRMMEEDVTTIERSLRGLAEHAGKHEALDVNQQVRWVMNKETHADRISEVVTEYFLKQRIKAPAAGDAAVREKYLAQLETLHAILVTTMKAKQTVDATHAATLRELIERFKKSYFTPEELKHEH